MEKNIYGGYGEEFFCFRLEDLPGLRYEKIGGQNRDVVDMEVTDQIKGKSQLKRQLYSTTFVDIYLLLPYGVALMNVRSEGTGGYYGSVTLFGEEDKVLEVEKVISDAMNERTRLMGERQVLQKEKADLERRLKEM